MDIKGLLTRRVAEVIDHNHLERALHSGKKLRVKLGIDPTGRELHIGHAVPLLKLREFQDAGHTAVFIVGDWTAMIGDPSGKSETRKSLTFEETRRNAKTYFDQAFKILKKKQTEIHYNSEWFKKFDFHQTIQLLANASVSQLMAHETFRERLKKGQPFFAHELLYPMLQGYDSVAVRADVELGANDQKFNLLMGRQVQKAFGQASQDMVILQYLTGLDGRMMGKTLHNYIALNDSAGEMFGKVMSLTDDLVGHYFELCTEVSEKEIARIKKEHPKAQKVRLAKEIVTIYHGAIAASGAEDEFNRKFGKGSNGGEGINAEFELKKKPGSYSIVDLLAEGRLAASKSEARRKLAEGAVQVDGTKVKEETKVKVKNNTLIRLGKRFLRVK